MKSILIVILLTITIMMGTSQTAVNFTCSDCSGVEHDLFDNLDTGKVIVICWVMPCGSCIGASLTTYNVVKSFDLTHPGRVAMYLVDDYANTSCSSLRGWALDYNISDVSYFSHASISMWDYGSEGMPKIVVTGGVNHKVYYNANNSVNGIALRDSILSALSAPVAGISDVPSLLSDVQVFPNPFMDESTVYFSLLKQTMVRMDILDIQGKVVQEMSSVELPAGKHKIPVHLTGLVEGLYFLRLHDGITNHTLKVASMR